jgi:hypothetical protein
VASDIVSISGLSVKDQVFGAASEKSEEFSRDPNDGLLGLAFKDIAQTGQPTFFENLVEKKRIHPLFSVHLTRRQKDGSELCFGCSDETKIIGDTVWVPLLSRVGENITRMGTVTTPLIPLKVLLDRLHERNFCGCIPNHEHFLDSCGFPPPNAVWFRTHGICCRQLIQERHSYTCRIL